MTSSGTISVHFGGSIDTPGLDWWLEVVFWCAVFSFAFRYRSYWVLAFAIGGCLHLVNPNWFFGLTQSLPWIAVGAFLELWIRNMNLKRKKQDME